MKIERKRSGILGLLGAALVVVVLIGLLRGQEAAPGAMLDSPLPTPLLQATPTPSKTTPMPPSAGYKFGEPKVIFSHSSAINIIESLPNSEEVLLTLQQSGVITETIITLNFITGEQKIFGQRLADPAEPVWLNEHQQVAFTARTELEGRKHGLWINGAGESQAKQPDVTDVHPTILGYGEQVLTISEDQGQAKLVDRFGSIVDGDPIDLRALGFDLADLNRTTFFNMESSPANAWIALFDNQQFVIVNLETGETMRVDLGAKSTEFATGSRWAIHASWSPNGRYLAIITTIGDLPIHFTELVIWDSESDDLRFIGPSPFLKPEQWDWELDFISDIAWAPDSYHLAIMKSVRRDKFGVEYYGLHITRIDQDNFQHLLDSYEFGAAWGNVSRWSPDGTSIIASCPEIVGTQPLEFEAQLCLIPVEQVLTKDVQQ